MFETFLTRRWPLTSIAVGEAATRGGGTATGVATTRYICPLASSIAGTVGATPGVLEVVQDQGLGCIVQGVEGSHLACVVVLLCSLSSKSASLCVGEAVRLLPQGVHDLIPQVLGWRGRAPTGESCLQGWRPGIDCGPETWALTGRCPLHL